MRNRAASLVISGVFCGLVACQGQVAEPESTGSSSQEIKGGDVFTTFDAACAMHVTLPPDDEGMAQDPIYCGCAKVAPALIITSATCVEENLTADALGDIDVRFGSSFDAGEQFAVEEAALHRYYNPDQSSQFDLALLRLDGDPLADPVVLSERDLTPDDRGPSSPDECPDIDNLANSGCAVMVGYGETDNGIEDFGAQRKVIVPVRVIEQERFLAGTDDKTTCAGDSGGPVFMDFGDGLELVAVSSRQSSCFDNVVRTRVQPFLEVFIYPYIDRFGATCGLDSTCEMGCPRTPDPDCDDCSWNEVCEEDCPTRDWDCDLGVFPGGACEMNGECERQGRCIPAEDDESFTYCSEPCDPADDNACTGGMECADNDGTNECVWPVPSPGSQGYPCTVNLDCRSGICEELICVEECDPGAADPCPENLADPDQPYTCGPSNVMPGTNVCLGTVFSGGGGFCQAGSGRGLPLGLILVGMALFYAARYRSSRR